MPGPSIPTPARLIALGLTLILADQATAPRAHAQIPRYELGRRVRAFETDWTQAPPEAQLRASPHLKQAVSRFFALALSEAARGIDQAHFALASPESPSAPQAWAASLSAEPQARLLDASTPSITLKISVFYPTGPVPPNTRLRAALISSATGPLGQVEVPLDSLPADISLPLDAPLDNREGDHELRLTPIADGQPLATSRQILSLVHNLANRLTAAETAIAAMPEAPLTTNRASARFLLDQLQKLAAGSTLELDVPASRRLQDAEALITADAVGRSFVAPERPGDFWLALAIPGSTRSIPVRLAVPEPRQTPEPRPLIIALHGAGGSENLFFESYGAGAIVGECQRRGWILLAPRSPLGSAPIAEMVEALAQVLPIDRNRVVLIGHSMGAAQATSAATADPPRFAALIALGGGGRVRPSPALNRLPVFIGIGTEDFALRGAQSLAQNLENAGAGNVTLREYPGIEHLAIVQAALPDALRWLEPYLQNPPTDPDR